MVYKDESSNDLSTLDISSSSDDMMYRVTVYSHWGFISVSWFFFRSLLASTTMYMGIKNSALDVCLEHGLPRERLVAFEGFETGRRFLVCSHPPRQNFGFVGWVDEEWPPTMQNALLKLWEMLEDNKSARRDDNLENSLKIHHLTVEKRNLDANYDKLVEDVNQLLNLAEAQGGVIRTQKANHLKEKDKFKDEILLLNLHIDDLKKGIENLIKRRDELKNQITDQLKVLDKNQEKLKMIRDILDG
ncbi:hypothetical protein D1007_52532 [Hordeum vulgare]|nr:hypothetical protein D1007_52532 [Hordeum vulgare]